MLWEDADAWNHWDTMNAAVSDRHSLLADDASTDWPVVKYLTALCLVMSFFLFVFYCVAACIGHMAWWAQICASVAQLLMSFGLALSLGLGLQTDTVKPQMFGNYFFGCDVHAEPGASWWFGVLALVMSVFAGVILLFPYIGGPTWVLKWARARAGDVVPSEEEGYDRLIDALGMDESADPFAGIMLLDHEDYEEDYEEDEEEYEYEGGEWESDEESESDSKSGEEGKEGGARRAWRGGGGKGSKYAVDERSVA
jgi:hypothetical protein